MPGVIAGAADADPTTVVAIAIVGASTIYGLAWAVLLVFPLLAVVQVLAVRLSVQGHRDLQSAVRGGFGRAAQLTLLISLLVVNLLTVAADLEGGAAAIGLLTGWSWRWLVVPVAIVVAGVPLAGAYETVRRFLLAGVACLAAYVLAAFFSRPGWAALLRDSVVPTLHPNLTWTGGALAILGTTLTAYVYVWLTIQETEDRPARRAAGSGGAAGAVGGVGLSVVLMWFILASTGATLGVRHEQVGTVADAAQALRPVAGAAAGDLFGIGLLASALVALPVIAATSGFVAAAQAGWRRGLSEPWRAAPGFYAVLVGTVAAGALLTFVGVAPVRLLYGASIAGGIATPVGLLLLVAATSRADVMRGEPVTGPLRWAGWFVAGVLTALSLAYLVIQLAT